MEAKERAARVEVERLRAQIDGYERRVREQEKAAKERREKNQAFDREKRSLVVSRRQAEEAATVLEWRLQKAAAQLDKEQPGAPLAKCLHPRHPIGAGVVHRGGPLGAARCGARAKRASHGSDEEME